MTIYQQEILIEPAGLGGSLVLPEGAQGLVLFAHGSGSSRFSPRNNYVAGELRKAGLGTLLFDLLTEEEAADRANVFDISFLAQRLMMATDWVMAQDHLKHVAIGYFGSSTGAAAALVAEVEEKHNIRAIVSRGGRPDLAMGALPQVRAPTLLIVGGLDTDVIELNEQAYAALTCEKELRIVPGATHLFEEPGTLDKVIALTKDWFSRHLQKTQKTA